MGLSLEWFEEALFSAKFKGTISPFRFFKPQKTGPYSYTLMFLQLVTSTICVEQEFVQTINAYIVSKTSLFRFRRELS